ncbi:hypothetical protein ACYFX5_04240 [Bremerella sp. T1]|uniref:EF-hand domain-containing protein n=1 Tax=Bremerella sp. TYQ1 TaxID=3119568 RepID=UPI001CCD49C1|nr:EF-hand domain-containing protein [Bremerella volcania]UBM37479.1 EF-hand domain-containing protein [Bremerella volcania]
MMSRFPGRKKRTKRSVRLSSNRIHTVQMQQLEARQMLAGDMMVENSPPVVEFALSDVTAKQGTPARLLDVSYVFSDADVGDSLSISVESNSNAAIVTPSMGEESLLLVFSEQTLGTSTITLKATDTAGESVMYSFDVNLISSDSGELSARIASADSATSVGTTHNAPLQPETLHEWESAQLELWYTIGSDTPTGPFNFATEILASPELYAQPTEGETLGDSFVVSTHTIFGSHRTVVTVNGLDLSSFQSGDRVLVATLQYAPSVENGVGVVMDGVTDFPEYFQDTIFTLESAFFANGSGLAVQSNIDSRIAPVVFDATDDGKVSLADFGKFVENFGRSSDPSQPNYSSTAGQFDYNRDGRVSLADYGMFVISFGSQRGSRLFAEMPGLTTPWTEAESTLPAGMDIAIADAVDHVFDEANQILYVTTEDGHLERWDYENQVLLARYEDIAQQPSGLDITVDGAYAYVGDAVAVVTHGTVWKVDLTDGSKTALTYARSGNEQGVYDLAIAANGKAYFTTDFAGSGWTPLREIDLATGLMTNLRGVRQNTGITRGENRSLLYFQESNISSGPTFTYNANTDTFSDYLDTHRFVGNLPAAVSPNGEKVAVNNSLLNAQLSDEFIGGTLGYALTFDGDRPLLYGVDIESNEVLVHDARTLQLLRRISIGADVSASVEMSISSDSKHLFITTVTGIRQIATAFPGGNPHDLQAPEGRVLRFQNDAIDEALPWITLHFSEPITGLTLDEIRFSRDGGENLLTGNELLFSLNGGRTWILFGAETLMTTPGVYTMHIDSDGTSIQDFAGNRLGNDIIEIWTRSISESDDVLLPIEGIRDQVYDEVNGILYITTEDGDLQRWDVAAQRLLASINDVVALPGGLDVTADGRYAFVGEAATGMGQGLVWKIDLVTGQRTVTRYDYESAERGVFDIEIGADEQAYFTTSFAGSSSIPLRSIDVVTDELFTHRNVRQNTSITRGEDRSILFFQESNSSNGPVFTYDVHSQTFPAAANTGMFVGSLPDAVSRDGNLIAFLNSVVDSSDFSTYTVGFPDAIAYVFDPTRDVLYVADAERDEIVAYDPLTGSEITSFPIGEDISGIERMTINEDASLVFLTTDSGLRQIPLAVADGDVVPPLAAFATPMPSVRYNAVGSLTLHFNEPVTGVTLDDFVLTVNGDGNLLTGSETVVSTDGGRTWVISGLANVNDTVGNYQLTLIASGSGIEDFAGNTFAVDASIPWNIITESSGGELLAFGNVHNHVFDPVSGILYVTTQDGSLHRWDVNSQTLLDSFSEIANNPSGLDITPDGEFAYIGDRVTGPTGGIVWKVNLSTGEKTALIYELEFAEQGVRELVIAGNGKAFFTTSYGGSGWTPIHQIDLATDVITNLQDVTGNTEMFRSADRNVVFFREGNISSGPIFTYNATTDSFSSTTNLNSSITRRPAAVNSDGSLIVLIDQIFDGTDLSSRTSMGLGVSSGYVFHPTEDLLFVVDSDQDVVIAYDPINFTTLDTFPIGEGLSSFFLTGTIEMSITADGSTIFVTTPQGIRAIPVSLSLPSQQAASFLLEGESTSGTPVESAALTIPLGTPLLLDYRFQEESSEPAPEPDLFPSQYDFQELWAAIPWEGMPNEPSPSEDYEDSVDEVFEEEGEAWCEIGV